jgi:hypothetical protein
MNFWILLHVVLPAACVCVCVYILYNEITHMHALVHTCDQRTNCMNVKPLMIPQDQNMLKQNRGATTVSSYLQWI